MNQGNTLRDNRFGLSLAELIAVLKERNFSVEVEEEEESSSLKTLSVYFDGSLMGGIIEQWGLGWTSGCYFLNIYCVTRADNLLVSTCRFLKIPYVYIPNESVTKLQELMEQFAGKDYICHMAGPVQHQILDTKSDQVCGSFSLLVSGDLVHMRGSAENPHTPLHFILQDLCRGSALELLMISLDQAEEYQYATPFSVVIDILRLGSAHILPVAQLMIKGVLRSDYQMVAVSGEEEADLAGLCAANGVEYKPLGY